MCSTFLGSNPMNQEQLDTINIIQEVLRVVIATIAAQPGIDLAKITVLLQASAADERFSPIARKMLADLAEWPDAVLKAEKHPH